MTMTLLVNGTIYEEWISGDCVTAMDSLARTFGFTATSNQMNFSVDKPLQFQLGDPVEIFVDGSLVLTGTIEIIEISGDAKDHTISVQGRDNTSDLLDSTMGDLSNLKAPVTLKVLCEKVLEHIGSEVEVVDNLGLEPFQENESEDIIPEPVESCFDYVVKWARKREVLLTSTPKGELFFTQPEFGGGSASFNTLDPVTLAPVILPTLQHIFNSDSNNVLTYTMTYDSGARFTRYITVAQADTSDEGAADKSNEAITDQIGDAVFDEWGRKTRGRQLAFDAETYDTPPGNLKRTQWEANIRKVRGRTYDCKVAGYQDQHGALWEPGSLVYVDDDFAGISAQMRVNSVTFTIGPGGEETALVCLDPNAYTLTLEEPSEENVGEGIAE